MESVLRYLDWMSVGLGLLGGLFFLLLLEIFRLNSIRSRSPPGPRPLPFVGNLPQILKDRMAFIRLMPKYGEICSVYLAKKQIILLNSMQILKEAFVQNGDVFSGRPSVPVVQWVNRQGYGIVMANYGHSWRQQRRFALHTLRDFGLGKKTVEERVTEEAQYLTKEMLKLEGKAFYPKHLLMNAVSNIICSIIFGDRFDYDNRSFATLLDILNRNIQLAGSYLGQIFNLVPFIKHFPGPHQEMWKNASALRKFILEIVEEHKKTLDPDNPRDFIDAYLIEMTKQESKEDSTFHVENMMRTTTDLFSAGTDTTANTLRWGLVYMMSHPDVQERCHEEIVRVLGFDRSPCMDDRARLPYTCATVHEIQRYGNIIPFGVLHQTTKATQLQGYHLPAGTNVLPNFTAFMTDKEHWKYPDTFNPENFLDEKGQFCKNDYFMVFSLGPRACLGETLARTELFIFFTSLLQRIKFSWPPGAPPYNMKGVVGVSRSPLPFNTICLSRETTH
ncbi:cytochrome P450 2B4-like [Pygocentrus nattereri]|uniref:Cytochrome P450, family 2, subfamily AE, polypeptide 1 n=1 Tax=Pygocentrus nattereri TaxID=42514 RepID=A0A3B4CX11_PYGNA|nr:cytochrome P450 2B4-like [Pygocentrus nattereri]